MGSAFGESRIVGAAIFLVGCWHAPASRSSDAVAEQFAEISRADWVVEWSAYTEKKTPWGVVFSPSAGAHQEVLTAEALRREEESGKRPTRGLLGSEVHELLQQPSPIGLAAGEVLSFDLTGEPVASVFRNGSAANIYWTTPHHKMTSSKNNVVTPFSAIHIQGNVPGHTVLRVLLKNGSTMEWVIAVR